jgi:hypothetical protein
MDDRTQWDHSAVLGAVRVSAFLDTWEDTQRPRRLTKIDQELIGDPPDRFLWKITEARRLRHPIPCDGYLKIWEPDRTLAIAIGRAVRRDIDGYVPAQRPPDQSTRLLPR